MKFNFRKIASVLASTVMLSSTVALAAAANYPSPFVKSGVADVAVVYGSTAAQTDLVAATEITTNLNSKLVASATGPTSISGGDSIKLERSTDKFNLGDDMADFYSTLDDEELSNILASGIYQNDDNEEFDFEQTISLGAGLTLTHFVDSSLDENEVPVIGFDLTNGDHILNYTLEFTDPAEAGGAWTEGNALETTEITMLGRTYYVVSARNTTATNHKITLLDTANSEMISEGETASILVGGSSYDVSIDYISSSDVILTVNGVKTNKLQEGDVYKVAEDLYVSVKNILYNEKESGISKVDMSLGSGKIVLENSKEVKMNNEDMSSLTDSVLNSYISVDGNNLESITLEWILDDDAWIVPGTDLLLPGFETIKFSMGGLVINDKEMTSLEADGDDSFVIKTTLKDGDVSLNILYLDSGNTKIEGFGEKDSHRLVTSSDDSVILNETENSYFVVTRISGDDAESHVFEIQNIEDDSGKNKTTLRNLVTGSDLVFSEVTKTKSAGSIDLTLNAASDDEKIANISASVTGAGAAVYLDRLVTNKGLMIKLPTDVNLTANDQSWVMNLTEETDDGDIQAGNSVLVNITLDGDDGLETTSSLTGVTMLETEDGSDVYEGYVVSSLATKFVQDRPSSGLNSVDVEYHGEEVAAEVYISESAASIVAEGGTKILPVKDSEAPAAKNLVVVGGSCVNSVAASLLGGALCGADFEAKTGVGAGSFLIETFARDGGAVATLVAGYNAEDTTNAAKYLTTQTVDTTVGKKYKGTSATAATLVVA